MQLNSSTSINNCQQEEKRKSASYEISLNQEKEQSSGCSVKLKVCQTENTNLQKKIGQLKKKAVEVLHNC